MANGVKTGGRQKGTPNKINATVKEALQAAFQEAGGKDYLLKIALTEPKAFCALLGKAIPQELQATVEQTVNYVARLPSPVKTVEEWQSLNKTLLQ